MNQIKAKVYYLISTGEVLIVVSEMQGDIEESTKEQDIEIYPQLKSININEVDYIELDYGTLSNVFNNSKSYKVNIETKKLEVIYYTQEELNAMQQQSQKNEDLNARINDITEYLSNSDETTIADLENSILQKEQNKINNGGM